MNPHASLSEVIFTAFNARDEFRIEVGLVFDVIGEPLLKLEQLLNR